MDKFDFVFVEMPAIISNVYSPDFVEDTDLSIMIIRANRTWQEADENSLKSFTDFLIHKPMVLLNGVNPELLQGIIGEIPRNRSKLRRVLKKMVRLQFFERQLLKK